MSDRHLDFELDDRGSRIIRAIRSVSCVGAVLVFVLVCLVRPAVADEQLPSPENAEAKQQIEAGNKAFLSAQSKTDPEMQRHDFDEAILHYRAGAKVETKNHFTFYWNLGHAYRQVGDYRQADWFYSKFLEFAPKTLVLHRGAAEKFIAQMRDELARKATLMSPTDPAPSPMRGLDEPPAGGAINAHALDASLRPAPWYGDRVGWALTTGGAAGVLVGGGFILSGAGLYDQAKGEDRQTVIDDLESRGRRRVVIGTIAGGVGLVVLAVGVVKLVSVDRLPSATPPIQVTLGASGISLVGSF